jgi:hypothetical protein
MRALANALRALPVTFAIYVVEAVLALWCAGPLGLELGDDARATLTTALGRAIWLDRASELAPALRVSGRSSLLALLVLLLLSPWLQMAWLHALARPLGMRRALEQGSRLYLRALSTSLLLACVGALLLLPWAGAAWLCHALVSAPARARVHDLLLCALLSPCALVLVYLHLAHDLARARALTDGVFRAVRVGLRTALRASVVLAGLSLFAAALAVRGLHFYAFRHDAQLGAFGGALLLQAACLAALFVRSLWLSVCLTCTESRAAPGDAR